MARSLMLALSAMAMASQAYGAAVLTTEASTQAQCPTSVSGTTSYTITKTVGYTETAYTDTVTIPVQVDCHGYEAVAPVFISKGSGPATTTVTATGTVTEGSFQCAASVYPAGCPTPPSVSIDGLDG